MTLDDLRPSTIVYLKRTYDPEVVFHLRDWNDEAVLTEVTHTSAYVVGGTIEWKPRTWERSENRALCGVTIRSTETWGKWPWEAPMGGWKDTDHATMLRLDHARSFAQCCGKCRAILGTRETIRP